MKFAHFAHVWNKAGMTPGQRYDQLWRELQLADELGFDYGFCVEHHFRPDESWMSSPSLYAVAAGARTRRIRLGAMGHVVPLHHPVRLVEEIALADQIIGGRLEVGLVPGIAADYFGPFGADFANRREKTLEFVNFLKTVYGDSESVDFDGPTIQQRNLKLAVKPAQRPHPPLWMETRDRRHSNFAPGMGSTPAISSSSRATRRSSAMPNISPTARQRVGRENRISPITASSTSTRPTPRRSRPPRRMPAGPIAASSRMPRATPS